MGSSLGEQALPRRDETEWAPLKRSTLSDEIADRIIASILNGKYKFGEKLPPERDLARYLNVGRPTVREAIRALTVIGLIEVRQGEGTFVVNDHASFVAKAFGWAVLLDARTATEVAETRIAIETESAGLAATRASGEQLAELRRTLAKMRRHQTDRLRFSEADLEFHLALAQATGNAILVRLLEAIRSLLSQWITQALSRPATFETALVQHEEILAAVESGDAEGARLAMRHHLEAMATLFIAATRAQEAKLGDEVDIAMKRAAEPTSA